jgi:hypothetical protein
MAGLKDTKTQIAFNPESRLCYGFALSQLKGYLEYLEFLTNDKKQKKAIKELLPEISEMLKQIHIKEALAIPNGKDSTFDDSINHIGTTINEIVFNEDDVKFIKIVKGYDLLFKLKRMPKGKYKTDSVEGYNLCVLVLMRVAFAYRNGVFNMYHPLRGVIPMNTRFRLLVSKLHNLMANYYNDFYNADIEDIWHWFWQYCEDLRQSMKNALPV